MLVPPKAQSAVRGGGVEVSLVTGCWGCVIINKLSSKKHKVIHHMNDTNIIIIPELILLFNQFLLMNIENQLKIMIRINCISVFD